MMSERRAATILTRARDLSLRGDKRPTSAEIREATETLGFGSHMLCESKMNRATPIEIPNP